MVLDFYDLDFLHSLHFIDFVDLELDCEQIVIGYVVVCKIQVSFQSGILTQVSGFKGSSLKLSNGEICWRKYADDFDPEEVVQVNSICGEHLWEVVLEVRV